MEIVRPLGVDAVAAVLPGAHDPRIVEVAFGDQHPGTAGLALQRIHLGRQLLQDVHRRGVHDGVDGVDPEPVQVIVPQPHERVVAEEPAHLVAIGTVQVHRVSPGSAVAVGEVRAEPAQVIPLRAEVVVDHVQEHGEAPGVAGVHQAFEPVGTAVGLVGSEEVHPVVAPAAGSGEPVHRHQPEVGDPQVLQVIQARRDPVERPLRRERPHVEFVHRGPGEGFGYEPRVGPGERRVIHRLRGTVDSAGLARGAGIGKRRPPVEREGVFGSGRDGGRRRPPSPAGPFHVEPPLPQRESHRVRAGGPDPDRLDRAVRHGAIRPRRNRRRPEPIIPPEPGGRPGTGREDPRPDARRRKPHRR